MSQDEPTEVLFTSVSEKNQLMEGLLTSVSIPEADGSFVNFCEFVRCPRKLATYYNPRDIVSRTVKEEVLAKSHTSRAALLTHDMPPPPPDLTTPPNRLTPPPSH
jgi:hypothetical protein